MKKTLFMLSIALLFSWNLNAENSDYESQYEISDIYYDYELIYNDKTDRYDCIGSLGMTVKVFDDFKRILFCRTREHRLESDRKNFIYCMTYEVNGTDNPIELLLTKVRWGTYFRIRADFEDGSRIYSPTLCVNDYIAPDDWEKIKNSNTSGVGFINEDKNVEISLKNQWLKVKTDKPIDFSVIDLFGRVIYNGRVLQNADIPIENRFIIVQYNYNGKIFTKKIIAQ